MALANPAFSNQIFYQEHLGQSDVAVPASPAHGKVDFLHNICADCPFVCSRKQDLEQHALDAGHSPFPCICGAQFARFYCLTRHINSKIGPNFPCGLCEDKSFPRLDKLGDHLRRWHRVGVTAFNRYKDGSSPSDLVLPPTGRNVPKQAEESQQAYPAAHRFNAMSMFDAFPLSGNTAPDASSVQSTASPGSSTATDNWGYSQPGNNTAYPS